MYIEEFSNQLCLDQETLEKAKVALQQFPNGDEKIYVPAVVYLCCQSCEVQQVDGQTKLGNGITLTQIIRNLDANIDIEQFLVTLQDLPQQLKYHSTEFENVVRQANFSYRLYKKFDKCFSLIQPVQNPDKTPQFIKEDVQEPYIQELKKIAWILCIIVRQKILIFEDEQEHNYIISDPNMKVILILVASLSVIFSQLPSTFIPNVPDLQQKMLSFFCSDFSDVNEELHYYQDLCQKCMNQISLLLHHKISSIDLCQKFSEQQLPTLFQEIQIEQSYKRLHKFYIDLIRNGKDLDEECFLRQRVVFTPTKSCQQFEPNEFETIQKKLKLNTDPPFMQTPLKDNKFSNTQEKSYFDIKKTAVPQTPISKCMELHQWMKKVTSSQFNVFPDEEMERDFIILATNKIREYFLNTEVKSPPKQTEHELTILNLCFAVVDSLIQANEDHFDFGLLNNQKFMFGILALSLFTYQIVIQKPNLLANMKQLCQIFEILPLDLFRVIANFAHFNRQMPQAITTQLFELEKCILFNLMWQTEAERVVEIFKEQSPRYFESELIRRFLNHLALRVKELASIFSLDLQDQAYEAIQQFMKNPKLDVLKDINIDTVIICTFYVIQKHNKLSPQFNTFNKLYNQYYSQQKQVFPRIVEYYNEKFLNAFRDIIKSLSTAQPLQVPRNFQCQSPLINRQIPVSPNNNLRAIQEIVASPQPNFIQKLVQKITKDIKPFKE